MFYAMLLLRFMRQGAHKMALARRARGYAVDELACCCRRHTMF